MLLAELTYTVTLTDIATLTTIAVIVFGAGAGFFGMKFIGRSAYYSQRSEDMKRIIELEKKIEVISAGLIQEIMNGMKEVREELVRVRESREELARVLGGFEARLAALERRPHR